MTPVVPDLTCKELVELVTDYLEETLPVADRARFELHLACCEPCRDYLQQMRQVLRSAGRLGEESLPDDARAHLLAAFRGWKTAPGGGGTS